MTEKVAGGDEVMTLPGPDERLSRISTRWTVVFRAHGAEAAADARQTLVQRYHAVAYRYLLGAVRDPDTAEELCQEFALRLVRGDFRRADPERGRFRDYLKRALSNLVTDHHRARQDWPRQMAENAPEPAAVDDADAERDYLASWRAEILERTWQSLAADNAGYYQVLHFRIGNPDVTSAAAAERLSAEMERPVTAEWYRKNVERAQKKFADLLVAEVAGLVAAPDEVEKELRELDLLRFCRSVLQKRSRKE